MRRALEQDHDLLGEDAPPNDLVLGAPALLGIFFSLALVCAVCFGFGYSSGHGLRLPGAQTAANPATPPVPVAASKRESAGSSTAPSTPPADQEPATAQKPAPGIGIAGGQPSTAAETQAPAAARHSSAADEQAWPPGEAPAPTTRQAPALPATNADSAPVTAGAPAAAPVSLMVQIAAVSRAADAQTLATALRHDGFASVVRTTTGDPFFHVQVGPFTSLQAAKAMRTRLTDSGYNAFIKP